MTRSRLLLAAVFTVVLSGAATRSLWSTSQPVVTQTSIEAADFNSAAAWRYRQAQPHHWRTCMLQQ